MEPNDNDKRNCNGQPCADYPDDCCDCGERECRHWQKLCRIKDRLHLILTAIACVICGALIIGLL